MTLEHPAQPEKLPRRMRAATAEIDVRMAPLIRHLWRLGMVTTHCCEGNPESESLPDLAYIAFRSVLEAALFVALAGPTGWDNKTHAKRHAERPEGTQRWTWDWRLEDNVVRFPSRDIERATAVLARARWRLMGLIGA